VALLSKDQILRAADLPAQSVEVPEWGGAIQLRVMTGMERDAFEGSINKDGKLNTKNLRARLVALCAVDADGKRLFAEKDLEALGGKSAVVLDRLFDECQRINGMSKEAVETIEKNCDATDGDAATLG
jgi:hypothetical protein